MERVLSTLTLFAFIILGVYNILEDTGPIPPGANPLPRSWRSPPFPTWGRGSLFHPPCSVIKYSPGSTYVTVVLIVVPRDAGFPFCIPFFQGFFSVVCAMQGFLFFRIQFQTPRQLILFFQSTFRADLYSFSSFTALPSGISNIQSILSCFPFLFHGYF